MGKPREYTVEECREQFLQYIRELVRDRATSEIPKDVRARFKNPEDEILYRCRGVAFHILTLLDGCACDMPYYRVVVDGSDENEIAWSRENGKNWWPEADISSAVELHQEFAHKEV